MKRLHVHVAVDDLSQSIRFYSTLFAAEPTVRKDDYAKWMLDDPRVNFAISKRAAKEVGIEHLGIQIDNETELADVYDRLSRAERPVVEEKGITCCYAKSDKRWIADPQGVAWETFLTHGESTVYGQGGAIEKLKASTGAVCCEPALASAPAVASTGSPCCEPTIAAAPAKAASGKTGGCCAA